MPHPWNGSTWTYAAYAELVDEATKRDVVLLFPSGLGNSLYTAPAEDEVLRAIDAVASRVAVDPARVSIAGASMGGAGATTIGLHHPDRFACVTSWFGDARYDLATYVKPILRDEAGAHAVNAADVADNARWVPVWLIHGEDDRVSPIAQSEILARELASRGFAVRFDRAPGFGHSGALVAKFVREAVARASEARAPQFPARVMYRSVRAEDRGAYGVGIERDGGGDAFVDLERGDDGVVRVHRADRVRAIALAPGALGASPEAAIVVDPAAGSVRVAWTR
jgi:dienelactone hydrolase